MKPRKPTDKEGAVTEEDLTPDQTAMVMWLHFIEKFKVLPAKQKIAYLCGFCESIDEDICKEIK